MKMTQLPIEQASEQQLRDFAETMQLEPAVARDRESVLALLKIAWPNDYILVSVADEGVAAAQTQPAKPKIQRVGEAGGVGSSDPKVRLIITKTTFPGGRDPVPVGVNGKVWVVQRDLEAELPYRHFLALKNALRAEITQDEKTGELHEDNVTNYPMNVVAMPSPEEIAAFHARTAAEFNPA